MLPKIRLDTLDLSEMLWPFVLTEKKMSVATLSDMFQTPQEQRICTIQETAGVFGMAICITALHW